MIPTQQQWPRGPVNGLHIAARDGSLEGTIALLSRGLINIDQGDPTGGTPLMAAALGGHSRVARVLLSRGANVSIKADGDCTALHASAQNGHLAVTVDLIKAGADLEIRTSKGSTPLHQAARNGHSEVVAALIAAGADVNSEGGDDVDRGCTPLFLAAGTGRLNTVRELIRGKANPLSVTTIGSSGWSYVPLDAAAEGGHFNVVRELIKRFGIKGCGGASGGVDALCLAARERHGRNMIMLTDAGVVDTGQALHLATRSGGEAAVKLLLQQRQLEGSQTGLHRYVNVRESAGATALFRSVDFGDDATGVPRSISPRMVQLLVEAGADTTSAVQLTDEAGVVQNFGTPLAYTNQRLREKKIEGKDATEEQLHRLEAVRRLLMRVEAVHAVSWLWHRDAPSIVQAAAGTANRTTRTTPASSTQLTMMLRILRRRRRRARRGALLAPLLRYSSYK